MFLASSLKLTCTNSCVASTGGPGVSPTLVVLVQNHCAPHVNPMSFMEVLPIVLITAVPSSRRIIFPRQAEPKPLAYQSPGTE